jgi:hypothetical protein
MEVLLVDDRDGRVLAQFVDGAEALRTLDELEQVDPDLARVLCLVKFDEHHGSLVGTETTTTLRVLS